jgi:hypothetical protein
VSPAARWVLFAKSGWDLIKLKTCSGIIAAAADISEASKSAKLSNGRLSAARSAIQAECSKIFARADTNFARSIEFDQFKETLATDYTFNAVLA